jgi:hypothetical protein
LVAGSHILTCGEDTFVKIFKSDNVDAEPCTLEDHDAPVTALAIDGKVSERAVLAAACSAQSPPKWPRRRHFRKFHPRRSPPTPSGHRQLHHLWQLLPPLPPDRAYAGGQQSVPGLACRLLLRGLRLLAPRHAAPDKAHAAPP